MAIIDDRRTTTHKPLGYVMMTDSFLSGWGMAPNRSLYGVAYDSVDEADRIHIAARMRSDMKRVRTVTRVNEKGHPRIHLHSGDHLLLTDKGEAPEWFKGMDAAWVRSQ